MMIKVNNENPNEQHEPKVVTKGINKDGKIIPGELTNMNIKVINL